MNSPWLYVKPQVSNLKSNLSSAALSQFGVVDDTRSIASCLSIGSQASASPYLKTTDINRFKEQINQVLGGADKKPFMVLPNSNGLPIVKESIKEIEKEDEDDYKIVKNNNGRNAIHRQAQSVSLGRKEKELPRPNLKIEPMIKQFKLKRELITAKSEMKIKMFQETMGDY